LAGTRTHTCLLDGRCRCKCDRRCCHELRAARRNGVGNWRNGADPRIGDADGKWMDITPDREEHSGGRNDRSQDCRRLSSIPG
jgi:hypothetical protein